MADMQLIHLTRQGDKAALEALIERYYDGIYAYCCRRTGNAEAGADLTQDVFLKLVQSMECYRFTGKFRNFLFTIAVNTCRDYLRTQKPAVEFDEAWQAPETQEPGAVLERQEQNAVLRRRLDALPGVQREALILYYYHNFKLREVAAITGVPLATAKSRIRQGLSKLRRQYEQEV